MSEEEKYGPGDDHELVCRCKKGELDAFEELVIKHQKKMFNIAFRMVNNYEDASEIVQDAFFSAYKGIQRFEKRSSFSTWLCTIVINTSRNRLQQIKSAARHEQFSLDDHASTGNGSMRFELASDCPSAEEQLEKKEMQERVQACIERLETEYYAIKAAIDRIEQQLDKERLEGEVADLKQRVSILQERVEELEKRLKAFS